jgi:hypothetical protein
LLKRLGGGFDHPPHLAPRLKKGRAIAQGVCVCMVWHRANFTSGL